MELTVELSPPRARPGSAESNRESDAGLMSPVTLAPVPNWLQRESALHEQEHGPLPDVVSTQGRYLVPRPDTPVFPLLCTHGRFLPQLDDCFRRLAGRQEERCRKYGKDVAEEWPGKHTPPEIVREYHEWIALEWIINNTPDPDPMAHWQPQDICLPDTEEWREFFRDAQEDMENWHPKWDPEPPSAAMSGSLEACRARDLIVREECRSNPSACYNPFPNAMADKGFETTQAGSHPRAHNGDWVALPRSSSVGGTETESDTRNAQEVPYSCDRQEDGATTSPSTCATLPECPSMASSGHSDTDEDQDVLWDQQEDDLGTTSSPSTTIAETTWSDGVKRPSPQTVEHDLLSCATAPGTTAGRLKRRHSLIDSAPQVTSRHMSKRAKEHQSQAEA